MSSCARFGPDASGRAKALACMKLYSWKKRLNFVKHLRNDLPQITGVYVQSCVRRNSNQTVVSEPLLAVRGLLRLDRSEDAGPKSHSQLERNC